MPEARPKLSKVEKIRRRLDRSTVAEKKCCRRFCRLALDEQRENNLLYGALSKTSALRSRASRVAFFLLAVLL